MSPSSASAGSVGPCDDGGGAGQQPGADPDQQLDQQRLLVGEVPVDRGPADTRGGADVLQPHREIAALGDKAFGRGDQLERRSDLARLRRVAAGADTDKGAIGTLPLAGGQLG